MEELAFCHLLKSLFSLEMLEGFSTYQRHVHLYVSFIISNFYLSLLNTNSNFNQTFPITYF